jgi:hypothetical protein
MGLNRMSRYALGAAILFATIACSPANTEEPVAESDSAAPAAESVATDERTDPAAMDFVRSYAADSGAPLDPPTWVAIARIPDSGLTLAYLTGSFWCGSGGCNLLILRENETGIELVGEVSIARPPIRLLATQSNGLPDIGVHVAGGGEVEGYEALLAFDGTSYPGNPSVPPARRVDYAEGTVLIGEDETGELLN